MAWDLARVYEHLLGIAELSSDGTYSLHPSKARVSHELQYKTLFISIC